ncbi:MAG: PrgI family protein [bacterium]|nr:PrgI family protein [bacterium]MDZ4299479.1 PrgI family protein [Candidatus Sungbacteria bacterium]
MRQYQVPQFITVEDKVIGNYLTVKQFLFIGGGILNIIILRNFLAPFLFYPLALLIGAASASLAFVRIGEQPLPTVVKNALYYFFHPRIYIWRKEQLPPRILSRTQTEQKKHAETIVTLPKLSQSKLSDLAWSLDIKEKTRDE